jgi:hypothetical protein
MLDRLPIILSQLTLAQSGGEDIAVDLPDTGRNPASIFSEALAGRLDVLSRPESMRNILEEINAVWAAIFILVGVLCLLQGYRWHKWLIVIMAGLFGVRYGMMYGDQVGNPHVAAACLAVLGAVIAWPLMKYSVAVFGGLAGAFAGANIWTAIGQDAGDHRIGAMVGLIVAGLLAFTAFRYVVVGLTTIVGASALTFGVMGLLMQFDGFKSGITDEMNNHPLIVPVVAGSAALFGVIFQLSGGIKGMAHHAQKADPKAKAGGAGQKAAA